MVTRGSSVVKRVNGSHKMAARIARHCFTYLSQNSWPGGRKVCWEETKDSRFLTEVGAYYKSGYLESRRDHCLRQGCRGLLLWAKSSAIFTRNQESLDHFGGGEVAIELIE